MEIKKKKNIPSEEAVVDTISTELPKLYTVNWSKSGELGKGYYATVYKGQNKLNKKEVAVKCIKRTKKDSSQSKNEINALLKVGGHPNIVELYDVYENENHIVLVMELLAGGELFDRILNNGAYSEKCASIHIRKITQALEYMHNKGIVHRDLKPENLVLEFPDPFSEIKVSDFGLSKILENNKTIMSTICGTRAYCAPEINFYGGVQKMKYTEKVDVWSLGVILYVILVAFHPFDEYGDSTDVEISRRIAYDTWSFDDPSWKSISDDAKDLIKNMITHDPKKRFSTQDVLKHRWITQFNTLPTKPLLGNYKSSKFITKLTDRVDKPDSS